MTRRRIRLWAFALVALLIGAAILKSPGRPSCEAISGDSTVSIALARLSPGTVRFFCYDGEAGARMRFLLARDLDGSVHSAFDACEQCYRYHKGYVCSGGELICRVCGNRYSIKDMNTGKGSCVPARLDHQVVGDKLVINVADLKQGARLF